MKVLIVDDREENLYMLETLLKGNGFEVVRAGNGVEALDILKTTAVDLIISDILMPKMDGFQLCRTVKRDSTFNAIPCILYSASYTSEKDEELSLQMGADKYIKKPIEPGDFIKLVNNLIKDVQEGRVPARELVYEEKEDVLKLYNERLIMQLEQKMIDLEKEIAERKKTEEALKESQSKYLDLFENANDMIFTMDLDCTITSVNHMTCISLGYECEEIIGRNLRSFLTDEGFRFVCDQMQPALGKKPDITALQPYVLEVLPKSGDSLTVEVKTRFIGAGDRITGVHGIARDVTDRKKMEKELKKRVKDLEDFYDMAIGRELKMIDLKNEIKELKEELSKYKKE